MSSKTSGRGGGGGGHGDDGARKKKKKKKSSKSQSDECKKCATLLPLMYRMRAKLEEIQPEWAQYKSDRDALKAENENLRRQLSMLKASTAAAAAAAAAAAPPPVTMRVGTALPSSAAATTPAAGRKGPPSASTKSNTASAAAAAPHAGQTKRPPAISSSPFGGRDAAPAVSNGLSGRGGGTGGAEKNGAAAAAGKATEAVRKESSQGEKVRGWTAAVARQKRERTNGGASNEAAGGAGGGDGGGGGRAGGVDVRGGGGDGRESGGLGWAGMKDRVEAQTKTQSSGAGNGGDADSKKGKEKKNKGYNKKKEAAVLEPATGVFATTAFGFLNDGKENEAGEDDEGDEDGTADDTSSDSDNSSSGTTKRQRPRKRARTSAGGKDIEGSTTIAGGGRIPRTSSMLARGFQPRGSNGDSTQAEGVRYGGNDDGAGYEEDWSQQQDEEEVEWYEESPKDMASLGWSQVWRRGDAMAAAGVWEDKGGDGDGLGKRARAMAQKCRDLADADIAAAAGAAPESGRLLGPKALSVLLRLELAGKVTMEGVLMAVLRGRSRKRDEGFLGRLALQLLAGIDSAHASSLSDPDVLTLVVEELEGLADVLAAPSTSPELKGTGWGRETRLALELLSKTLTDWMEQAKRASKLGGVGGVDEDDNSGGYASMSFGNSKKKKKKAKEKQQKSDDPKGKERGGEGGGGTAEEEGLVQWTAEAEAPVLWWWETDDDARVPWGAARLLGLLLRRLRQPERTEAVLHSILVLSLGGPARLLRFPLAFLEAFPGHFFSPKSSPFSSAASSAAGHLSSSSGGTTGSGIPRANDEGGGAGVSKGKGVDGGGDGQVLVPGLWRRSVTAAMHSLLGGDGGGSGGGGAAIVSARLALVYFGGETGSGGGSGGGGSGGGGGGSKSNGGAQQGGLHSNGGETGRPGGERETAAELAQTILQAISGLHKPGKDGEHGRDGGRCVLCSSSRSEGDDGDRGDRGQDGDRGDSRSGACGGDDALALSTGLVAMVDEKDLSDELAVPRSRGELVAVEVVRALRVLGVGMESGGFPVRRSLVPVLRREGVCHRAPALASHVLAQCAGASRGGGGPSVSAYAPARALDMAAANVARTLTEALESDPEKWEAGQLEEGVKLAHGTKAQVASALLSLLKDRSGEAAAESELSIVEWTQNLKPQERLSTPLPLLMSVMGVLSRPPAHVINLTRRPYRWKAVADVARRQGVWLHRHDAVDYQVLEASSGTTKGCISEKEVTLSWATELNTMHDKDCEKETTVVMHPSERACAASHLDLWKRHRDCKLAPFMPEVHPDAVLILEDDARLQPGFLERAKATMLQAAAMDAGPKGAQKKKVGLNKAWDILYLGHILPIPIMEGITFAAAAKRKKAEKKNGAGGSDPNGIEGSDAAASAAAAAAGTTRKEGPEAEDAPSTPSPAATLGLNVAPVTFAWGLHAYLLTRAAAARLVDNLPVSAPADIFVASFLAGTDSGRPVLAGRAVLPALATTAGGPAEGEAGGDEDAGGDVGDVVSVGTRRAGVAHGVWAGFGGGPRPGGTG